MKIAYTTTFDARDVNNWSGTPYYMSNAFSENHCDVDYLGLLSRKLEPGFKLKQIWSKYVCDQRESPRFNIVAAKHYSHQIDKLIKSLKTDVIISPQINPVVYLESNKPLILWTDALYASLLGFYSAFASHSTQTIAQGNIITSECLARTKLAIFSSDWAARSAIELYGVEKSKVKVVPFGANIICHHTANDIHEILKKRDKKIIRFLFLGKHWERKGGDIVFNVIKALHQHGVKVELNFVGTFPPKDVEIPDYIKCHGFISKRTPEGVEKITRMLRESHFLFVPSRAEAYGIVFCEANAFGLPCLTSHVGGIATVVKDNINGMTFALDAPVETYCKYITELMQDYSRYEALALSSFNEYQTRLNWNVATQTVQQLIKEIL
ncbi:MAG: glycosyltransferase family 4 protein [Gammaproteobacteria bacterium]|nr:glycosyltransferase family 4 protein [Gammaproteobacteria bacterium]